MTDIQVIEKLIAMVGQAGEGTFWLAVMWIAKDYVGMFFFTAAFVFTIIIASKIIKDAIFLKELRDLCGISGYLTPSEKRSMKNTFIMGLKSEAAKPK